MVLQSRAEGVGTVQEGAGIPQEAMPNPSLLSAPPHR